MHNFNYSSKIIGAVALCILVTQFGRVINQELRPRVVPGQTAEFLKLRMSQFLEQMQNLRERENQPLIYFAGASEIESGLNAQNLEKYFKEQGLQGKTLNVGLRSILPTVYKHFIRSIEISEKGSKQDIWFFKLPFNKMTQQYIRERPIDQALDQLAVLPAMNLAFDSELILRLKVFVRKLFLGSASLNNVSYLATESIRSLLAYAPTSRERHFRLWREKALNDDLAWDLTKQGDPQWNQPKSQELLEEVLLEKKDAEIVQAFYRLEIQTAGYANPKWSPEMVSEVMDIIRAMKERGRRVILYSIPEPGFELLRSADAQKSIQILGQKLAADAGVEFYDISSDVKMESQDYIDFLHLTKVGQEKFYQVLISRVKQANGGQL